ncbi:MAG TPA: ABC transporter permease subunit [Clostridiales bacterium]|nr:ABC transporter permease subunit [Clostridiales bacterium]
MKKDQLVKDMYRYRQLYFLLALPIAYLIIFHYVPMLGTQIAFKNFKPSEGIWRSKWIGLDHFSKFVNSYMFSRVIKNTIVVSLYSLIAGFPIPIILALALNCLRCERWKKVIQTILYMPHFVSVVVIIGMLTQMFNPVVGLYGHIYRTLFEGMPPDLLSEPKSFPHLYVWSGIWQNMGWNSILYFAALSHVDLSLHESAMIDGASRFKRIMHIDIPTILPTVVIVFILNTGHIMNVGFEKAFLMQNNLNLVASEVISTYVYKIGLTGLGGSNFSYATAIGLFNSVINLIILIIVNKIAKKVGEISLW